MQLRAPGLQARTHTGIGSALFAPIWSGVERKQLRVPASPSRYDLRLMRVA